MRIGYFVCLLSLLLLLAACDSDGAETVNTVVPENAQGEILSPPERPCGNPVLVDVRDMGGKSVGMLEVLNDSQYFWMVYSPNLSNRLVRVNLFVGEEGTVPRDGRGNDLMSEFPYRLENRGGAIGWVHRIPLDSLPECFVVVACLNITDRELEYPLPNQVRFAWAQGNRPEDGPHDIGFCPGSCRPISNRCPGGTEPGQFCTLTPAAWGEQKWLVYLEQYFAEGFPAGLELGCDKKVTFRSAGAVKDFFPSSGPGKVLESNLVDPGNTGNGLAAEVCALSLALAFDEMDEEFCKSPAKLSRMLVAVGPFAGWNVKDLLGEANSVLGGCASNYSAGQMEEVIRSVNINFLGGTKSQGFLRCEGS